MKQVSTIIFILFLSNIFGQNFIDWDSEYKLQLSDFQSPATIIGEGNNYSLFSGSSFSFLYSMSSYEFMFTKNFNDKVNCYFDRNSASMMAPDTSFANDLLQFAQFSFDLSELYARKLRKRIYENKDAFSNSAFFEEYYHELHSEYSARFSNAGNLSDMGRKHEVLDQLHKEVMNEIEQLSEFCKNCKPLKKKGNRKKKTKSNS